MTETANVLTTRTAPTYADWSSPYARHRADSLATKLSQDAFNEFMQNMKGIEAQFEEYNATAQFPYVHLLPSKIDISISI